MSLCAQEQDVFTAIIFHFQFHYPNTYSLDQSIQKMLNFILTAEALLQTLEEKAEMDMYLSSNDEEDMPTSSLKDKVIKNLPWLALGAGIIAACTCTALGSTILKECEVLSVFAQKMTSIMGSVMEKVPWPQPHHGEEGLWQTIAILATSVLVSCFQSTGINQGSETRYAVHMCTTNAIFKRTPFSNECHFSIWNRHA